MKMTVRAGAFALATIALLLNVSLTQASEFNVMNGEQGQPSASINIARIKSVLKLTAAQEPYWALVCADCICAAAGAHGPDAGTGSVQVVSVVLSSACAATCSCGPSGLRLMMTRCGRLTAGCGNGSAWSSPR